MFGGPSRGKTRLPIAVVSAGALLAGAIGLLTRNWLIAVLAALATVLIVLVFLMVRVLIGREREERLGAGLDATGGPAAVPGGVGEADLVGRFREAVGEIRRSFGGRAGVYELPWYLMIGEPGSGKSTLLAESGLDLPAQYTHSRMFGPTRNCDFVLANQAILLDTTGRYLSSDAEVDEGEWRRVLALLRQSRPDCPIDGLIVTLPAATLLSRSPHELEDAARRLRQRMNQITIDLGVDAPVYLVITKADQIEGFVDTARVLPAERSREAFGWTNDQRRLADPEERIAEAFERIRERLDGFIPELVLREPDPVKRRRIFLFPQEIEVVGRAVARFAGSAFKRDVYYRDTPFLRGVYLASARCEGDALSPTLHRLGQDWGRTQHGVGTPDARYLRDLFHEVIVGDEGLAVPESRIGPLGRRAVLGAGGVVALVVMMFWGVSLVQNYQGTHALARATELALSQDPTIHHMSDLRSAILRETRNRASFANWIGFGILDRALERASRAFVWAFERSFAVPTLENLAGGLRSRDDTAFRAAVTMATYLEWLATEGEDSSDAPDLSPYMPRRVRDAEGFAEAYASYVRWMPRPDREEQLERQRDQLSGAATRMLDIAELEQQTTRTGGKFSAVRYQDLGLTSHDPGARDVVPGIYTSGGFEGLFGRLVTAVERTGSVPPGKIKQLERTYVERYDRAWRRFLLDAPSQPREDIQVRKSPYLALLEQADTNTRVDLPRDTDTPRWIKMLREIRRTLPFGQLAEGEDETGEDEDSSWTRYVPFAGSSEDEDEGGEEKQPPWTEYSSRLDVVAVDVEDAASDGEQALLLARDVAEGKPNSFEDAMQTIRRIVPRRGDAAMTAALRGILERPVLDGFTAVLASARRELDRRWDERIASRFRGILTERDLQALYEPGSGELDGFRATELAPFQRDDQPKEILGDRAMSFGPLFLRWMRNAGELQRMLFSGTGGSGGIAVRLKGIPSTVQGGGGELRVLRRDLRLVCPDGEQTFAYREGSGAGTFNWDSSCQELTLRIVLSGAGGRDQQIQRAWSGPLALPSFLQEAQRAGGDVLEWSLDGPGGEQVSVKYRVASGQEILRIVHQSPPTSLGS